MARSFEEEFHEWLVLRSNGLKEQYAIKEYYNLQNQKRDQANQVAALAGERATWAWRRMKELENPK